MNTRFATRLTAILLLWAVALFLTNSGVAQEKPPVQVTIRDEKPVVIEPVVPLDPMRRIQYQPQPLGVMVRSETNQTLHLSHFPALSLDGQFLQQGQGGRVDYQNRPLPRGKGTKDREGFATSFVYPDNIRVTVKVSVEPTKPSTKGAMSRLDAVMIHYTIENQGKQPHKVGLRIYIDTYVIDNDGCLFAAPTIPDKLLDGIVLRDKLLPPYVQMLQRPDLRNPGFVAHLSLDLGPKLEKPDRVVLTHHGAGLGTWEMPVMPAQGDSALGIFWEPRELKPGGIRECAYGFGQGIVTDLSNQGQLELALGGSFELGKLFDVTAYVTDPAPGQYLTLAVPEGVVLAQGKQQQAVPPPKDGETKSVVFWRASMQRPGEFAVRVHSSTGTTVGKLVAITQSRQ
jgi:hypothetical protein